MGKTTPWTYYHIKNRPLLSKRPKGCKTTKGRLIKYPGRPVKIINCSPKK